MPIGEKTDQEHLLHFKRRLRSRYGIRATSKDLGSIKKQILSKQSVFIFDQNQHEIHIVEIRKKMVKIVIRKKGLCFITALPRIHKAEKLNFKIKYNK